MNTDQKLSKLDEFLHDISREPNAGLGGEAGYYVFSYDPKDEMRVRQWTKDEIKLLQQAHRPVVEFDLYKIMAELLIEKHPAKIRRPGDADWQHDTRGECGEQCFADRTADGPYAGLHCEAHPTGQCCYPVDRCWKMLPTFAFS